MVPSSDSSLSSIMSLLTNDPLNAEAYRLGYETAGLWMMPHMNPYIPRTEHWLAWEAGYAEGGKRDWHH